MLTKISLSMLVLVIALVIVADVRDWMKWIALLTIAWTAVSHVRGVWKDYWKAMDGRDRYSIQ